MRRGRLCLIGALMLAGCAAPPGPAALPTHTLVPSTATPASLPPTATATLQRLPGPAELAATESSAAALPAQAQTLVGRAMEALAQSLGVSESEIRLRTVEAVLWPDADLGCGSDVGQVEPGGDGVEGYRIVLEHQGSAYEYHTDDERVHSCETESGEAVQGEPIILDPILNSLIDLARRDLAERLDLPLRRMFLAGVVPYDWPDASLGCPLADQEYVASPSSGYRIVLRVGQENYIYHSDYFRVFYCPEEAEVLPVVEPTPTATHTLAAPDSQ